MTTTRTFPPPDARGNTGNPVLRFSAEVRPEDIINPFQNYGVRVEWLDAKGTPHVSEGSLRGYILGNSGWYDDGYLILGPYEGDKGALSYIRWEYVRIIHIH